LVEYVSGKCPRCGKIITRVGRADIAVCDCWEYCPRDHGKGRYGTKMEPYIPDLTLQTYEPLERTSEVWGDLKHPIKILRRCPVCGYLSSQLPVEVELE